MTWLIGSHETLPESQLLPFCMTITGIYHLSTLCVPFWGLQIVLPLF
jgi:hypothetical protein